MHTRLGRDFLLLTVAIFSLSEPLRAQEVDPIEARYWHPLSVQGLAADRTASGRTYTSPFGIARNDLRFPVNSLAEHLFFVGAIERDIGYAMGSTFAYFPVARPLTIGRPLPEELAVNSDVVSSQHAAVIELQRDFTGWLEVVNAVGGTPFGTFGSSREQFCSGALAARYPRVAEAAGFNPAPEALSSKEFGLWLVELASSSGSVWADIAKLGVPLAGLAPPDAHEGLDLFEEFAIRQCIVATSLATANETRSFWGSNLPNPEFTDGTFAARLLYNWYDPSGGNLAIPVATTVAGLKEAVALLGSLVAYSEYLESTDTPRSALDIAVVNVLGAAYAASGDGGILGLRGDARAMLASLVEDVAKRELFEAVVTMANFSSFMPGQPEGDDVFNLMPDAINEAIFDRIGPYLDPVDLSESDLVNAMGFSRSGALPSDQAALINQMAENIREWIQSGPIRLLISDQRCAVFEYMSEDPFDEVAAGRMVRAWLDGLPFETTNGKVIRLYNVQAPLTLQKVELDRRLVKVPRSEETEAVGLGIEDFLTGTCHFSTGHQSGTRAATLYGVADLDGSWTSSLPDEQREAVGSYAEHLRSLNYWGGPSTFAKASLASSVAWAEALPTNLRIMVRAFQRESYNRLQQSRETHGAATVLLGSEVVQTLEFAQWRRVAEEASPEAASPETGWQGEAMLAYPIKLSAEQPPANGRAVVPWVETADGKRCLAVGNDGLFISTNPANARDCIRFALTVDNEGSSAFLDGRDGAFAYLQTHLANVLTEPVDNLAFWKFGLLPPNAAPTLASQLGILATYSDMLKTHPIAMDLL